MAKKVKRLAVHLTDREQIWALVYLLASYFLLPELLRLLNAYLPTPLGSVWSNFLYFSINFLVVIGIFGGFFRRSLAYAGQNIWRFLIAVVAGFVVYWLCNWGISWVLGRFFPDFVNLNDGSIVGMAGKNFAIMFIGTVILVPVAEEALYRGLVFGCLYPKSHAVAYILSVTVFACVHILGYAGRYSTLHMVLAFVQYVPAGACLAWAYRKSGSIFAPMLIHATINAVGMFAQR